MSKLVSFVLGGVFTVASSLSTGLAQSPDPFISRGADGAPGLRLAVKDLIHVAGMRTTQGSKIYAQKEKDTADADCLANFTKGGWTVVGKTKLSEFAVSTSGINDYGDPFTTPTNPLVGGIIPGGSSCGSAVAVALGLADVALGTDTAGSIRVPSACCGVYGLKTTYNLVSRKGVEPLSDELDTVGPMALDVDRLVKGMDLLVPGTQAKYDALQKLDSPKIKIERAKNLTSPMGVNTSQAVEESIDAVLTALTGTNGQVSVEDVTAKYSWFPSYWNNAHQDGITISRFDAYDLHQNVKNDLAAASPRANAVISLNRPTSKTDAEARGATWQGKLQGIFADGVSFIVLPVMKTLPPPTTTTLHSGETGFGIGFYMAGAEQTFFDNLNTVPVNVAGNPAIVIPIPMPDKSFPFASLQVIGPMYSEAALLDLAKRIESLPSVKAHRRRVEAQRATVEGSYAPLGPYATTTDSVNNGSVTYKLYHPKTYSSLGFKSPIITWGNGTGATTDMYSDLLNHFASYGFTVVAPELQNTGSGNDIGAAARYMVNQNTAAGPFKGNLDVSHVAAVGHSQGAGGSVEAALKNPDIITNVMTFSLPDKAWASIPNPDCPTPADCTPDVSKLTQPVFFISTRGWWDSNIIAPPATEKAYFDSVKVQAAMGIITNSDGQPADHNSIQNANSSNKGNPGGFMGYATAWLEYQLLGNAAAGKAFTGSNPEIVTNPNWSGSAVK
jgi:Asp-tRNA(Asn)/Glu-tRNA(Gln) amidotransferase A subunit family amidase/pimeloyl-ACP methyl ester carboxylesterase